MRKSEQLKIERESRLKIVNELMLEISSCGRRFFHCNGIVAYLFIRKGKVYYKNEYSRGKEEVCLSIADYQDLNGFIHGGTLRELVLDFKRFVMLGPGKYNYYFSTKYWGYDEESTNKIKAKAIELGYLPKPKNHGI